MFLYNMLGLSVRIALCVFTEFCVFGFRYEKEDMVRTNRL